MINRNDVAKEKMQRAAEMLRENGIDIVGLLCKTEDRYRAGTDV